ncbi:MAG: aminotransferase class I/II-fold pyridoxal phosphate-dependent enzyme [Methanomicrobia archaeon]|nr:aminotransferase class I/II-fold pyridoxal phosphate-dependent enzyme [Methanomicrobia archaeon]
MKPAKRAMEIEYAIRDVVLPARELEKKGVEILKLNIGDPDKFDFDTPEHMKKAVIEEMEKFNGYGDSEGLLELREAIVEREKKKNNLDISVDDIVVTNGVSESIQMLFGALLEPGDEILVPGPTYPPYIALSKFFGATPVPYRTIEEENWAPDLEDMRKKITEKTKAIAVINPNNPTGALYDRKTLEEIGNIVAENDILLISDEIYDMITYEGKHLSPSFIKDIPLVIFNGISKVYLSPGWRVGWTIFRDCDGKLSEIKEAYLKQARVRICASILAQKGAAAALNGPQDHIKNLVKKLRERRDYIYKRLNEIDGISTQKPGGAFYIFPKIEGDDKKFVLDVLNKAHVLFVHGSGFCPVYGKGHFRSVFLPPLKTIEKAMDALEKYMKIR